jgi:hypothetical protein
MPKIAKVLALQTIKELMTQPLGFKKPTVFVLRFQGLTF